MEFCDILWLNLLPLFEVLGQIETTVILLESDSGLKSPVWVRFFFRRALATLICSSLSVEGWKKVGNTN